METRVTRQIPPRDVNMTSNAAGNHESSVDTLFLRLARFATSPRSPMTVQLSASPGPSSLSGRQQNYRLLTRLVGFVE